MLTRRGLLAALPSLPAACLPSRYLPSPNLNDPGDQRAFLAWYTWLAEAAFFWPGPTPPREIRDCSSLVRFAFRNALLPHTAEWAHSLGLTEFPPLPALSRRGFAPLLRTGAEEQAHFADAAHLMRYNFRRLSADLNAAQPGDALFWCQQPALGATHVMVFLGPSRFESAPGPFVVYHTGPDGKWAGELRRPSVHDLLNHPEPRWHPVRGNPRFLGVFRWNLLLGGD
jgi:uncharacterized protein YfaT (DUF1175 family)